MIFKRKNGNKVDGEGLKNNNSNTQPELIKIGEVKEKEAKVKLNKIERTQKEKSKHKEKVTTFDLISEKALNRVVKGVLDNQSTKFEIGSEIVMSLTHNKRIIQITELPDFIKVASIEKITDLIKNIVPPSRVSEVEVSILETCLPKRISMADKKVKSTERNLRRIAEKMKEELIVGLILVNTGNNINTSRDSIDYKSQKLMRMQRKIDSYEYINSSLVRGIRTISSFIFIEISCKDNYLLTDTARETIKILNSTGFKAKDITDLKNYLSEFGLASIKPSERPKTRIKPILSTAKLSSLSSTYEQGMIRSKTSDVYIGHEIVQNYPAYISYSETSDKFVELILADSGSGKTTMCVTRSLFALNHTGGTYKQVIRDYKGEEGWTQIANMVKGGKEVSMKTSDPSFINTMIIPDNTERFGIDRKTMFQICTSYTAKMLTILSGAGEEDISSMNRSIYESIAIDIVKYAYRNNGVFAEDERTYFIADTLPFTYIMWDAIKFVTADSSDYASKYPASKLNDVRTALQPYFTNSGGKSYLFRNPITIESMLDSDYVVFNYGLKVGAGDSILAPKDTLFRNVQETFFVRLYSAYNYLKGKHTLYWIEDIQAQYGNTVSMNDLSEIITIGRAINIKPILIANEVSGLFNGTDAVSTFIKNINTITIGRVKESVAYETLNYLGLMEGFNRSREVFRGNDRFYHSFLVLTTSGGTYNGGIVKVLLPKHVVESNIFTTTNVER